MQLVHAVFDAVEHAIECVSELRNLIVPGAGRYAPLQIGLADVRRCLGDVSNVAQGTPGRKEDDSETQQHDGERQDNEPHAQVKDYSALVPLGKAKINEAAVAHNVGGYSKRHSVSAHTNAV